MKELETIHCNESVHLASKSIDMIDAVEKGYEKGYIDGYLKAIENSTEQLIEIVKQDGMKGKGTTMERLTNSNGNKCIYFTINDTKISIEDKNILKVAKKLKEYEDAEEKGLLFQFPVPIGSTVYKFEPSVSGRKKYIKTTVMRYDVYEDSIWFCFSNGLGRNITDFGKYVFLKEKDAKQKLKEMEEICNE